MGSKIFDPHGRRIGRWRSHTLDRRYTKPGFLRRLRLSTDRPWCRRFHHCRSPYYSCGYIRHCCKHPWCKHCRHHIGWHPRIRTGREGRTDFSTDRIPDLRDRHIAHRRPGRFDRPHTKPECLRNFRRSRHLLWCRHFHRCRFLCYSCRCKRHSCRHRWCRHCRHHIG